jgi:hypothetical protein
MVGDMGARRSAIRGSGDGFRAARRVAPSTDKIHSAFLQALRDHVSCEPLPTDLTTKPLDVALRAPLPRLIRAYIYAATSPLGERSVGDYKSQLMVPGQGRQGAGTFAPLPGAPVLLVGYADDFDVWILWDAGLHDPFAFSTNVQVKAESVYAAAARGIEERQKRLRSGHIETIVVAHSTRLAQGIQRRLAATAERLAEGRI